MYGEAVLRLGMRIGFTGTRHGMTPAQERTLHGMLAARQGAPLHHGDCIGADAQAHELASLLGHRVTIHPPNNNRRGLGRHRPTSASPRPTSLATRTSCARPIF